MLAACLLVLVTAGALALALWLARVRRFPPGPFPLPFVGNLLCIKPDRIDFQLAEWSKRYGPIFTIWMPHPVVIFADYDVIKKYFVQKGEMFAGRPPQYTIQRLYGGNYGLIRNENWFYKEQRSFALHALRDINTGQQGIDVRATLRKLAQLQKTIADLAYKTVEKLREQSGEAIELRPFLVLSLINVMNQICFGEINEQDESEVIAFKNRLDDVVEDYFRPMVMAIDAMPWLRFFDFRGEFDRMLKTNNKCLQFIQNKIDQHRTNFKDGEPRCFVDAFLLEMQRREKRDEKESNREHAFTEIQLTSAVYDLFAAGTETTLATLRYSIIFLLNHPHVQERLHRELDANIGQKMIGMEDSLRLPYLNAVIQEVHRVSRIAPFNLYRTVTEDVEIDDFMLAKNTVVIAQFQCILHDESIYSRPDLFLPERHLNAAGEFARDERILPFSVGKRSCLGEGLAKAEIFLFLAILLQAFEVRPEDVVPPAIVPIVSLVRQPQSFKCRLVPKF